MISRIRILQNQLHLSIRQLSMQIEILPLNSDNYGYLLIDEKSRECAVVDVSSQPDSIARTIHEKHLTLRKILTTHKHWDHAGGNNKMKELFPGIQVFGSKEDSVEGCTHAVGEGDTIHVGSINIHCIQTPGHTKGHVCYFATCVDSSNVPVRAVFTGDTLFVGGCGRFFEGTAADMYPALQKLAALPGDTLVYCGHEYTQANYEFAMSIDGRNRDLSEAVSAAALTRSRGAPTVPSTIDKELRTNPFLRCSDPDLAAAVNMQGRSPVDVLARVRELKNEF